jgi:anti-anti-sigma factor
MRIKTKKNTKRQIVSVSVSGSIYGEDGTIMSDELRSASDTGLSKIALDLSRTTGMDSCAMGVIIYWSRNLNQENRQFMLVNPSDTVKELFVNTNLDKVIKIIDTNESYADGF